MSSKVVVYKTGEIEVSGHAKEVELRDCSRKNASVKGFELDNETEQEKDVTEAMILANEKELKWKESLLQKKRFQLKGLKM